MPFLDLHWRSELSFLYMVLRLRRHCTRYNFDALLSFGFYPNLISWAALLGLRCRPALVLTEINQPYIETRRYPNAGRRLIVRAARRLIYPRADLFAANSKDGILQSILYCGVDPDRARRLPNLVNPAELQHLAATGGDLDCMSDDRSICITSRHAPEKRIDTLLEAAAGLPLGLQWSIDIIGNGSEHSSLIAMSNILGISSRCRFHGWLSNPFPVLSRASIFVLCSEYEGFSNSLLEALALGVPVVTSLCSADAREMCDQGVALGFAPGDAFGLRFQLERALSEPNLRERLKMNGYIYAQRHTISTAIGEYEALIREAIHIRHTRGIS